MDLYHKKLNVGTKNSRRFQDRNNDVEYQPSKKSQNIYIQKMIPRNENFEISAVENIPNVRSSMEDIFSNEDNKKRAIKYVINIGRNKNIRNSPNYDATRRFEKSASPNRGRLGQNRYAESYETTPSRNRGPHRRGESYFNNRLATLNDYTPYTNTGYNNLRKKNRFNDNISYKNNMRPSRRNYSQYMDIDDDEYYDNPQNYGPVEESQNDLEFSSINDDDRMQRLRNVDPNRSRRTNRLLNETYEKPSRRMRNKDITALPNMRNNRYLITNNTTDDDVDELIRTVEDLQTIIDGQKQDLRNMRKDNYNKDKEIGLLKLELDNMQKELDDKRLEHDKEIDDIFKSNDNNSKLKNEYFKLLQDYDTNINDYNLLKDDYNKMVDEYNNLKAEKNKLNDDNKNLKQNNSKLKDEYNNIKTEANKALDDYNNIVDDYDKLERELKKKNNDLDQLQDENDRLKKDYERIRSRNRGKQSDDKKDEEFNKLNDDYDKLNDELNRVNK